MKNRIEDLQTQAEKFARLTQNLVMKGHIARAKKLLAITEKLLQSGSQETQQIISSVFTNSFSSFAKGQGCTIKNQVPSGLEPFEFHTVNAHS